MSKVLYLLVVEGETLTNNEVTDVFFGATKLFQSSDVFFSSSLFGAFLLFYLTHLLIIHATVCNA